LIQAGILLDNVPLRVQNTLYSHCKDNDDDDNCYSNHDYYDQNNEDDAGSVTFS